MYEATFTNAARKSIENLPETAKNRIKNRIDALINDENVRGAIKLKGQLDGNDVFRSESVITEFYTLSPPVPKSSSWMSVIEETFIEGDSFPVDEL